MSAQKSGSIGGKWTVSDEAHESIKKLKPDSKLKKWIKKLYGARK